MNLVEEIKNANERMVSDKYDNEIRKCSGMKEKNYYFLLFDQLDGN